jgi:hypothetical protein
MVTMLGSFQYCDVGRGSYGSDGKGEKEKGGGQKVAALFKQKWYNNKASL